MTTMKLFGAMILASLTFAIFASEPAQVPVQPIGYFVDSVINPDAEESAVNATFTRDGETYPAEAGMPVFPGDIVNTPANGGIMVAFVNNNILQLKDSSQATIHGIGELSAPDAAQFSINAGHAFANIRTVSDSGFALNIGDTKSPMARASAPKPAVVEIVVSNNGGTYTSKVFVTAGTALLTPKAGGSPVALSSAGLALLTINTQTVPASGTVSVTATTKADIAAAKLGNVSDTIIKVGKGGSATITSKITNTDGTLLSGKVTTLNGNVTSDSWKAKGANKFSESWSEGKGKIGVSQTYTTSGGVAVSFKASLVGNTTTKATVKVGKNSYTGTATYDPATGNITFTSTKSPKDGSTSTFTFTSGSGSTGSTLSAVVKGGTSPGTFSTVAANGAPPATTPDGRGVTQNQPPKSN